MILRKPFGFAFIYALLSTVPMYLGGANFEMHPYAILAIANGSLVVYTIIYIFMVQAHLSHHFRLWASIYLMALSLVFAMITAVIVNPIFLQQMLMDPYTYLNAAVYGVVSFVLITIGNWLASFVFKSKGHI